MLLAAAGIAEYCSTEVALTRAGIGMDFGRDAELVPEQTAQAMHARYPRLDMARCLTDTIVSRAQGRPATAPPCTFPGGLVRERGTQPPSITELERMVRQGRWVS